jgi:hypothetical protein
VWNFSEVRLGLDSACNMGWIGSHGTKAKVISDLDLEKAGKGVL